MESQNRHDVSHALNMLPGVTLTSSGPYGTQVAGFSLLNASISGRVWKYACVEAGINNIFDKNYSLVEGYPEEGRNFFVTVRFFNHK